MRKKISSILLCIACGLMLFSGYQLYRISIEYQQSSDAYAKIAASTKVPATPEQPRHSTPQTEENGDQTPSQALTENSSVPFQVDFDALAKENTDVIGWIYCEGTPIDYPILQGQDNAYYLRRLPDGQYNRAGSIFMDFRCTQDFSDAFSIIYGHNMKNDSMFGTLTKYTAQDYYDAHPIMWLFTPARTYKVELAAGFEVSEDADIYSFPQTSEERNAWFEQLKAYGSDFIPETGITEPEHLLLLSTCSYSFDGARYVLVGNLIPISAS